MNLKGTSNEKDFGGRVGPKMEAKLRMMVDSVKNKIITSFPEEQVEMMANGKEPLRILLQKTGMVKCMYLK